LSFLNVSPPLRPGEQIRWTRPAAYCLDTSTVGGTLSVTTLGLVFMPNRVSSQRDWGPQRLPLGDIETIDVQERTGTPYNGGLRRRVRVRLRSGEVHLFIMKHPDETAAELRSLAADAASAYSSGRP
jgi:hypothetical protein